MNTKIRKSVFETNSSSQHSLIYKHEGRSPSELETDGGTLIIHVGDFTPRNHHELWTQQEKVGYIFTYAILRESLEDSLEDDIITFFKQDEKFSKIIQFLLEYTNCSDIKIVKDELLKMDSIMDADFASDIYEYGWWMEDEFLDFVFDNSRGVDLSYD